MFYISTYESVRHLLSQYSLDSRLKALVAGGAASLVGQTIIVPFDVLSQHLMMMGAPDSKEYKVYKKNKLFLYHTYVYNIVVSIGSQKWA